MASALSSCAGTSTPAETVTTPVESTAAEPSAPAPSPDETETEAADDPTARVQAVAGTEWVLSATEDAPGEFTIETDIIDPRTEPGSPEAEIAIEICEAVQRELGATHVRVEERDGSTFVVLGGAFEECTEA